MSTDTDAELPTLTARYPLGNGVGPLQTFTDSASVNGLTIRLAGLAAQLGLQCVTGAAASLSESPLFRAYMELIERLAIVDTMGSDQDLFKLRDAADRPSAIIASVGRDVVFPQSTEPEAWSWARSNGVAAGSSWEDAARRARLELLERDSVLRSWYGEFRPEPLGIVAGLVPPELEALYTFAAYTLGRPDASTTVVGFFGWPREVARAPTLIGYAARADLGVASAAAFSECLQQLGFLWGEPLPLESPRPSATPDFHQDYFLFPAHAPQLHAWLRGDHSRYRGILEIPSSAGEPRYVNLTPQHLTSQLRVAKAIPAGHVPLAFGCKHPLVRRDAPAELWVHPIA